MNDFKKGDVVRYKNTQDIGVITEIDKDGKYWTFCGNWVDKDGYNAYGITPVEMMELADPKTAFLTELQSLLRKYDAKIYVWAGEDGDKVLTFELKDNIDIVYPNEWLNDYKFEFPITPDNIFNYDKE